MVWIESQWQNVGRGFWFFPGVVRQVGEDGLLVHAEAQDFDELLREAFAEIGRFARADARVTVALLDALAGVAAAARRAGALDRVAAARELAEEIVGPAVEDARTEPERRLLASGVERVHAASG